MRTRPYRGWEDLPAMQAVCSAGLLSAPGRANAHPGDIAWMVGWPPASLEQLAERFLLWEVDDGVVGFASFDEGELAVFVMPELANTDAAVGFEDAVLEWVSRRDGAVRWFEWKDEGTAVDRWRGRGFQPIDEAFLNLTRTLEDVDIDGPADDRVRPVGDDDVEDRASITHAAFGSSKPFARYAAEYAAFRSSPAYPHGWDLLLRDDDGRPAACCIAWPDPLGRVGNFEPVATHPDLHRRGFGRALLTEGLRRFAAAGMAWAIVASRVDNPPAEGLYRSVGFRPDRLLPTYQRDA